MLSYVKYEDPLRGALHEWWSNLLHGFWVFGPPLFAVSLLLAAAVFLFYWRWMRWR